MGTRCCSTFEKRASTYQTSWSLGATNWMQAALISACPTPDPWTGAARAHLAHLLKRVAHSLCRKPRRATKFVNFEISEELFNELTHTTGT